MHGVKIQFNSKITNLGDDRGVAYYKLPLPAKIISQQRRKYHRVSVPYEQQKQIQVRLVTSLDQVITAQARDLSVGGIGLHLLWDGPPVPIKPGDILPDCQVMLPHSKIMASLEASIECTSVDPKGNRIGGRFLDLEPKEQRALEQYVAQLERDMLKKL